MIGEDAYYGRQEISNSDLSELQKYFLPSNVVIDLEQAYRFGNLVDALLTEPHRCDHLRKEIDSVPFTDQEWGTAVAMMNKFRKDEFCNQTMKVCEGQSVFSIPDFSIQHEGIEFTLPVRCKYDFYSERMGYGGDIKTTAATTQKQFEEAFMRFDYDRSRAWYMDISGAKKDVVIGISKKFPHNIFKIFITRDSEIYKSGKAKYQELAFRWWTLFFEIMMEAAA